MNNNKGFTLIELLVAMSIMAVLSILSLPLISSLQQNNTDMKYEKYKEAMEVSAKLYADSYEMDLFGYSNDGCGDIPYNTLKDRGLLKELQLEGISCDNSYSYVKVLKNGKNMKFQVSLHCTDENGNDTYKGVIKESKQICEGTAPVEREDGTPSCVGSACFAEDENPTLPDITAEPEYGSPTTWDKDLNATVKVIVSDADGLVNNIGFNYKWVEAGQSAGSIDYKPENLKNEYGVKETSKVIKRPEKDGEYKLVIQPTRVMDVLSNTRDKIYEFGPYYFDGNPPECPNVTANVEPKTWTNQTVKLDIAFASDIEKYNWTPGLNGKWQDTVNDVPRTKNHYDITTEGKNKFKLKIYDVAGNNIDCEDMYEEYYYDKTAPSIDLSTQKAVKKNLTIETEDKTSGLAGYAVTTTETTPTSWTAISGNSFDVTLTKNSGKYYVYVKDVAGNINHKSITVEAIPAPSCTISLSGTKGEDSWYKSNVTVTMSVEENPTTYGLSSESSTSTNKKTSVTRESNTKSITYYGYVKNEAGSNTCKKTFKLDKVAPAISVTTKKATKDNMTIKLTDNYSELDAYAVDTSSSVGSKTKWVAISGTEKTVTATGVHGTNYVHVRDKAGNVKTSSAITVKTMDPPTCTISLTGSKRDNGWYYSDAVTVKLNITGTATTKGLSTSEKSTNGYTSIKRTSDSEGVTYYGYVKNVAGSGTCSKKFKKDSTAPTIQKKSNGKIDYIKYKKSGVNIGSRFGYIFLDPTSGFDASKVYGEYCYVGHNASSCGATCKKGHQWSHNPAKLKSSDKREYLDIKKTYVPDSHKKDGAEKYRFEAGVSSSCVKGHDVRTYYKACDLAGNCTYTGLHIWEW